MTSSRALLCVLTLALPSTRAAAGPLHSLAEKTLEAEQILEVEVPIPPKLDRGFWRRWPEVPTRVVRVFWGEGEVRGVPSAPDFPFACLSLVRAGGTMRALVFLRGRHAIEGVEGSNGGLTSLNPDYPLIVDAVAVVSGWRARESAKGTWSQEIALVGGTPNPYLKYLGAQFLTRTSPETARVVALAAHAPSEAISVPIAPCFPYASRKPRVLVGK